MSPQIMKEVFVANIHCRYSILISTTTFVTSVAENNDHETRDNSFTASLE